MRQRWDQSDNHNYLIPLNEVLFLKLIDCFS